MSEKPSRRAPAFMLYVDDFLGGTSEMSAEEVGGYIRLLCHQWAKGGLPNDPERLGRMAGLLGSPSLGYAVSKFTLCEDGQLRHPRLEALRSERDAFLIKQAESGKKGAERRWKDRQTNGNPNGEPIATPLATPMANGCPERGSPSPSPSPTKDKATERSCDSTNPWHVAFGLELPESLRTSQCLQALKDWLAYKTEKRQGYKKSGLKAALSKWSNEFTPATFPAAVENSMANNWQGVFPPSQPRGEKPAEPAPKPEDAPFLVMGGYDWRKSL